MLFYGFAYDSFQILLFPLNCLGNQGVFLFLFLLPLLEVRIGRQWRCRYLRTSWSCTRLWLVSTMESAEATVEPSIRYPSLCHQPHMYCILVLLMELSDLGTCELLMRFSFSLVFALLFIVWSGILAYDPLLCFCCRFLPSVLALLKRSSASPMEDQVRIFLLLVVNLRWV